MAVLLYVTITAYFFGILSILFAIPNIIAAACLLRLFSKRRFKQAVCLGSMYLGLWLSTFLSSNEGLPKHVSRSEVVQLCDARLLSVTYIMN